MSLNGTFDAASCQKDILVRLWPTYVGFIIIMYQPQLMSARARNDFLVIHVSQSYFFSIATH